MKHTKEPWRVHLLDRRTMIASDIENGYLAETRKVKRGDIDVVNAKRIVACVNACADVEDDCLDFGYVKWLQQRTVELELSVMNLEEENARIKAQLTWRPVSEPPKENVDVEVCDMSKSSLDEREPVIAYYEKGEWICVFPYNADVYAYITPTHWRYIPPAPAGVKVC
jgi:hypothetical protein